MAPTCNFWLGLFLEKAALLYPHEFLLGKPEYPCSFPPQVFSLIMNLIDIAIHHPGFLSFSNSMIAATALFLYRQGT